MLDDTFVVHDALSFDGVLLQYKICTQKTWYCSFWCLNALVQFNKRPTYWEGCDNEFKCIDRLSITRSS